jgi:hypothetical protein
MGFCNSTPRNIGSNLVGEEGAYNLNLQEKFCAKCNYDVCQESFLRHRDSNWFIYLKLKFLTFGNSRFDWIWDT